MLSQATARLRLQAAGGAPYSRRKAQSANRAGPDALIVPSEYVEVVVTRR